MVAVPRFSITQTPATVVIAIKLPFIRVSSSETLIEGNKFTFSCSPYLLKLTFPGEIVDDEARPAKGVYDPNDCNGTLTVTVHKAVEGAFEDLDMTTKLLQPRALKKAAAAGPPLIEVVSSETNGDDDDEEEEAVPISECGVAQQEDIVNLKVLAPRYGFNRGFSRCFENLREELKDMCECHDVMDDIGAGEKRELREEVEEDKFDGDRYCADYFANDGKFREHNEEGPDPFYLCASEYTGWWGDEGEGGDGDGNGKGNGNGDGDGIDELCERVKGIAFDDKEQEALQSLPNRELLVEDDGPLLLGLIDVLFGYVYDCRMTEGESTVESPWTVSILSPTLSWFESWTLPGDDCKKVIVACARRSLVYPYCRSAALACKILGDVGGILRGGRRSSLKGLLAVRGIFERSDTHYMLNRFYMNDYCVWLQKLSEERMAAFSKDFDDSLRALSAGGSWKPLKAAVNLDLLDLESQVEESVVSSSNGSGG